MIFEDKFSVRLQQPGIKRHLIFLTIAVFVLCEIYFMNVQTPLLRYDPISSTKDNNKQSWRNWLESFGKDSRVIKDEEDDERNISCNFVPTLTFLLNLNNLLTYSLYTA